MPRLSPIEKLAAEARELRNARRRVDRARNYPWTTCPASRHLHTIADALSSKTTYGDLPWEQDHMAGTMYAVLESLWKLRAKEVRGSGCASAPRVLSPKGRQ